MKLLYKLMLLLIIALPLGFTACDDDDDENVLPPVVDVPELVIDKISIDIEIDKIGEVKISQGGGEYHAFSSNPDVVSVELENNILKLNALSRGRTSVIISDKNSQYKELNVVAFYNVLAVETAEIIVEMPLGHAKTMRIPITKGNGAYEVSTESDIVSATVENDSEIVVVATKEGTAKITLTDSYGLTLDIPVTISTTTIPYDAKELEEIMDDEELRYIYNAENVVRSYYSLLNTTENGENLYGLNYYDMYFFKIYFPGDKSVGVKSGSHINSNLYSPAITFNESVEFEIIKNDGIKIWAVYSFIKDEKLNFGHFCQDI